MQNKIVLGVSVGESFAEFSLVQNPATFSNMKVLAQKRSYLPREGLKNSLQQFLTTHKDTPPEALFLSLRFLEKLLDFRLGGSVAQVVTEGFENWAQLRSNSTDLQPLSSPELVFSIRERMSAQGKVINALPVEDLEAIASKLKMMDCKRICIHFLHSGVNATHEIQAAEYFSAQGFEVFVPEKTENGDEVSRWRKNTLNASVSGTFAELKENILEATKDVLAPEKIFFLSGDGKVFQDTSCKRLSSIFAAHSAIAEVLGNKKTDVLYLGLEKFTLLSSQCWSTTWESDWGLVENPHPYSKDLSLQPTAGLGLNAFEHLDFTSKVEGWEPGPMTLGRGQKPTFLDLWSESTEVQSLEGLKDRVVPAGQQRFKNTLLTLWKTCRLKDTEMKAVIQELRQLSTQTVLLESLLNRKSDTLIVTGPLTPLFSAAFKKDKTVTILSEDFIEARALAVAGMKALGALS
ncbi:hypothetical protein D3C87_162150 [compost metagenome]